jgi:prepilin-type N-terminal cleavage/methylation domain-containing protein
MERWLRTFPKAPMSARPTIRLPRGFTLIELLVASAVGGVILFAALATFDLQRQFSRNTEQLLGSQASAGLALTMMQRDLENAGYRFHGGPSDAGGYSYAVVVRPYDNLNLPVTGAAITQLKNDPAGATTIQPATAITAGFIQGTDAFEVFIGSSANDPNRLGSQVQSSVGAGGSTVTVNLSPDPFNPAEITAAGTADGPLLMFWTPGRHCMGRVTSYASSPNFATVTVVSVDQDLANSATPWSTFCPLAQMRAEVMAIRRRYLVYQSAPGPGQPAQVGLYLQSNNCNPFLYDPTISCSSTLGAPRMVSAGVDDMQIAWHVPAGLADGGTVDGWCQSQPNTTCGFDNPSVWNSPLAASIYGAQIYLASEGAEPYSNPAYGVPPMFNSPPFPNDTIVRTVMQTSLEFRNQVTP